MGTQKRKARSAGSELPCPSPVCSDHSCRISRFRLFAFSRSQSAGEGIAMRAVMRVWPGLICLLFLAAPVGAAGPDAGQQALMAAVDRRAGELEALSRRIWEYAEVALKEER